MVGQIKLLDMSVVSFGAGPSGYRVQVRSKGEGGAGPSTKPRKDHEQGGGAGLRKLDLFLLQVVTQQRCNGHCPCDSALTQQLKQQLRSCCAKARGHHLNTLIK